MARAKKSHTRSQVDTGFVQGCCRAALGLVRVDSVDWRLVWGGDLGGRVGSSSAYELGPAGQC